jgi:integrase/recombinase XerD
MFDTATAQRPVPTEGKPIRSTLDALASLPEEGVWLASRKSREIRQAYAGDVRRFMRLFGITSRKELRQVDRKTMMAYERHLREVQRLHPTTIRRRLSALSSLFRHLVQFEVIAANLVQAIERPAISRWQGMPPAFSPQEARALLDALDPTTNEGFRARAILSLGLQVGSLQVLTRYLGNEGEQYLEDMLQDGKPGKNRVVAKVVPEHLSGWDFRKLPGAGGGLTA